MHIAAAATQPLMARSIKSRSTDTSSIADAKGAESVSFIAVDGKNVTLEAVKKCEDEEAYIIRFVEKSGRRAAVKAEFFAEIASVTECNLLEREDVATDIADGKTLSFEIKPFEIKCYKVKIK